MALRMGLLSTARINDALLAACRDTDSAVVVAVASRDGAHAREYGRRHGIASYHAGYQSLLDDPDVDAVYVSLPNALHVEWTLRAIRAGKHVLCEKPLAWSGDDALRLVSAAQAAGVALAEAFMYRHHPQMRALAELLARGTIGRVERVQSRFAFPAALPQDAVVLDAALRGGATLDVGCYCVSVSRLVAGEPHSVTATTVQAPAGIDLRVAGTLHFEAGAEATFQAAIDMADDVGVEVIGSEGTAVLSDPWHGLSPGIEVLGGDAIAVAAADPYRLQVEDFAAAVSEGRPPLVSGSEIIRQARVLEAVIGSARQGGATVGVASDEHGSPGSRAAGGRSS